MKTARLFSLVSLVLAVGVIACTEHMVSPPPVATMPFPVRADVTGTTISAVRITVTASDLAQALRTTLARVGNTVSGTLIIPVGRARTIAAAAVDAIGDTTHAGSVTIDVKPGANPPVALQLKALSGSVPITIGIDSTVAALPAIFLDTRMPPVTGRTIIVDAPPVSLVAQVVRR